MPGHNAPQQRRGVEIRIVGFGADGSGVAEHIGAGQSVATCHFGEPLIPAGRVAHFEIHPVQFKPVHRVGVIGWPLCKVVILKVSLGDGNMEFAGASDALTIWRNNNGGIETALVGCPGALKEGDLNMHITIASELTCQRETRPALHIFSGGVRRALWSTIRWVATQGQFGQEHHVGTGTGTSAHALP